MQPTIFRLLLAIIFFGVLAPGVNAQSCTGSLGDPVINQDFGSGANPGAPLAGGITTMTYTSSNCPNDGQYTIANSLTGTGNCHQDTWHNVTSDHTGNPNGYMMIVNASEQPSVFFTQTANGLCPNTTYEFSAYVLNLIIAEAETNGFSEPNITFDIESTSGQVLATYNTGTIAPTVNPQWNQYGVFFTTPVGVTDVIVKMTNLAPGGNGNDLILDDITFRACGPVITTGFGSSTGQTALNLCQGASAQYTINANVMTNGTPGYQWQSNINNAGWVDTPGETTQLNISFTNAVTGSYQYRLGVSNGSDISSAQCRVYSPPVTVTVNPLPVVPNIPPQTVCEGYTLQLSASGGASYLWSGPNLAPTSQNPLIINNVSTANAGIYTVQVSTAANCSVTSQTAVTVMPKVVAAVSNNNISVCAGTPAQLTASGGLYYKWTPSTGLDNNTIANPVATPTQTTTYVVDVSNGGCSDSSQSVTVTVMQNPLANAGTNKVIFEGQSVKLDGTVAGDNVYDYYWTPTAGLNDPTSLTPLASPNDNTTYTLTAISQSCGISTSSVSVKVYKKVTIPNTFSPNNDGINDNWNIDALVTYPDCSVMIYDRYGQKVYESTGYAKPWDGTFNGSPLPQGTYYYIIDLKDNTPKRAGWVLIVR